MLLEITIINSDGSLPFEKKKNPKNKTLFQGLENDRKQAAS